jgi:hypothetical protein
MDTQDNTSEEGTTPSDTSSDQNASAAADAGATGSRPLGAWLRLVDRLIAREFATAFADDEVTRRDWMLLNAVAGTVDAPWMTERAGKRIVRLARRGWIARVDGSWSLTDSGREALDRLGAKVDAVRTKVAGALPADEFAQLTASLETIARELGWDESQPMPRRGRAPKGRERGAGWGPFDHGHGFGGHGHEFGERRRGHGHGGYSPECGDPRRHGRGFAGERGFDGRRGRGFDSAGREFDGPRRGHGRFTRDDVEYARGYAGYAGYAPGFADEGPDFGPGAEREHGFGPGWRGFGPGHHAHLREEFERRHHGGHGHDVRRAAEQAYERGFSAGFSAGADGAASTPVD